MPRRDEGLRWLIRYPARRWRWVLATLLTMLLQVGLDVLKPWPMKILVDHVLSGKPLPATLAGVAGRLPGGATQESLLRWSVAATVLLFVLGWGVGLAGAVANTGLGQRLDLRPRLGPLRAFTTPVLALSRPQVGR